MRLYSINIFVPNGQMNCLSEYEEIK